MQNMNTNKHSTRSAHIKGELYWFRKIKGAIFKNWPPVEFMSELSPNLISFKQIYI